MALIRLIVGLWNPGNKYADTRHNVGVLFVEALANRENCSLQKEDKFYGAIAKLNHCWLLRPSIYMNKNGAAVAALTWFYKIKPQEILVVHDELDFPVGAIRLKKVVVTTGIMAFKILLGIWEQLISTDYGSVSAILDINIR